MKLINTYDGAEYPITRAAKNVVITETATEDLKQMGDEGATLKTMALILAALTPDVHYVISSVKRSMTGAARPNSTHDKGWSIDMGIVFEKPGTNDFTLWLRDPWSPNLCDNHRLLAAVSRALTQLLGNPATRDLAWIAEADHWHITRCLSKALPVEPITWVYSYKSKQPLYDTFDPRKFVTTPKKDFFSVASNGNMTLLLTI